MDRWNVAWKLTNIAFALIFSAVAIFAFVVRDFLSALCACVCVLVILLEWCLAAPFGKWIGKRMVEKRYGPLTEELDRRQEAMQRLMAEKKVSDSSARQTDDPA